MTNRLAKIAGLVAFIGLAVALVILEFGGGSIRIYGARLSARSWERPLIVAIIAGAIFGYFAGRTVLEQWISQLQRRFRPAILAGALALAAATASFLLGTHVASGSDSFGYVSQADLWKRGSLEQPQAFALDVPWPNGQRSFTPLGYRPSVSGAGIVPSYSAGYPLLIAAGQLIAGQTGALLVVPLCFALAIWATYRLGEIVCSPVCGLIAAVLLAISPAVSFMALWSMSDVPALAFWTLCLAAVPRQTRRAPIIAGLFASVAILIRPNLFPAAAVIALWMFAERSPIRQRLIRAALFGLGALPGIAATAVINAKLYGSPLKSGYGSLDMLFAVSFIRVNLHHWLTWMTETETWFVFLALIPLALPVRKWWRTKDNRTLWLIGPFALSILVLYAAYEPFDAWWFLRFLLPAFAPLMVGAGILLIRIADNHAWRTVGVAIALGVFSLHLAHRNIDLTGDPKTLEGRYFNIAKFVDAKTPANSLFLAMQHSGSLRYYAHRLTLRYDYLEENRIPDMLAWCRDHDYHPYVIVEDWELPIFRKRFPNWSAALEPSLVFGYGGAQQVFVYEPGATGVQFEKIPAWPIPLVPEPMPNRNMSQK